MLRYLLIAALVCAVVAMGAGLVARAAAQESRDFVLIWENGQPISCEVVDPYEDGSVYYENCQGVTP